MASELFENLVESGRLVKIFWVEATGEQRIKKGYIVGADEDFIRFQTRSNDYLIHRSAISSMKILKGGGGG